MEIGIGLPTTIPGTAGQVIIAWAKRAEELDFSSLGVTDRLMYDCYEPLISLAQRPAPRAGSGSPPPS